MDWAQEIEQEQQQKRRVQCPVHLALAEMDPVSAESLNAAINSSTDASVIERVFVRYHRGGKGCIASHRAGRCSCGKSS